MTTQISLLALEASKTVLLQEYSIISAVLSVVSTTCVLILSPLEHGRSLRPSITLCSYLTLTLLLDAVRTRTLWLSSLTADEPVVSRVSTAGLALKVSIALLESRHKAPCATTDLKQRSPEEKTGIYGLGAYVWLNKLFLTGYQKSLNMEDLYPLDSNMSAEHLEQRLAMIIGKSQYRGKKFGLMIDVARSLGSTLLIPILPRVALIGLAFCQPFLINSTLSYLEQPPPNRVDNVGYGLIGATALIYFGLAFSTALYWYFHERSMWMVRGALASIIYKKTVSQTFFFFNSFRLHIVPMRLSAIDKFPSQDQGLIQYGHRPRRRLMSLMMLPRSLS